jgi:hypothetical protein
VVANFTANSCTDTITTGVSPAGAGSTTGAGSYPCNGSVTFTASAAPGYTFANWTINGAVQSTSSTFTTTASGSWQAIANFTAASCTDTITTTVSPSGTGTASGAGTYNCNSSVTVTASPATGYVFHNWTVNGSVVSSSPSYTFTATQSQTAIANFHAPPVANAGPNMTAGIGTSLSFNGSGSIAKDGTTISSYTWAYGDGSSGSGNPASHAYSSSGSYGVTLTVTDSWGATGRGNCSVTITNSSGGPPPSGNCIWSRHFAGTVIGVDSAMPLSIKEDHNGNVVVVGYFYGTVNFGGGPLTSAGNEDIFVAKYDSTGTFQWAQRFGSLTTDEATGVAIDSNDNIVVVGLFGGTVNFGGVSLTSAGNEDIFVAKYGSSGTLLWAKGFGGTAGESCNGVALDGSDNILITGYYGYSGTAVDFGGGPLPLSGGLVEEVFVAKLNSNGGYLWANGYASSGNDSGNGIAVDGSGNLVVVGSFQGSLSLGGSTFTSAGGSDVFVAKYSGSNGAHMWSVSGGGSGNDRGKAVAVDASGNVVVTGEFIGTASIGGSTLSSPYNPGYNNMFLAKYSATGTPVWSQGFVSYESNGLASGRGLAVDGVGNIVLTGYVEGSVSIGSLLLGGASPSILLAKFSGSGAQLWAKAYGGNGLNDVGQGVSTDASNNILATGYFGDSIDFGCGAMSSACHVDGFAAKLTP